MNTSGSTWSAPCSVTCLCLVLLPHAHPALLSMGVFWLVAEPLGSPPCPPPSFLLSIPNPHGTAGMDPGAGGAASWCVAEPGLPSRFPPCSNTPRQVVLAALGLLEETCQASSLCCSRPCFSLWSRGCPGSSRHRQHWEQVLGKRMRGRASGGSFQPPSQPPVCHSC